MHLSVSLPVTNNGNYTIPINYTDPGMLDLRFHVQSLGQHLHVCVLRNPLATGVLTVQLLGVTGDYWIERANLFRRGPEPPTDVVTFEIPEATDTPVEIELKPAGSHWLYRVAWAV